MENLETRWLIRADMDQVLDIEKESWEFPWTNEEFMESLRLRNNIGMVAHVGKVIHGYMIYNLGKTDLPLMNFAVRESSRRQGVGRALIDKLKSKVTLSRRHTIYFDIRESNLAGQMFLKSMGFFYENTTRDAYEECDEDCYCFSYSVLPRYKNRIAEFLTE